TRFVIHGVPRHRPGPREVAAPGESPVVTSRPDARLPLGPRGRDGSRDDAAVRGSAPRGKAGTGRPDGAVGGADAASPATRAGPCRRRGGTRRGAGRAECRAARTGGTGGRGGGTDIARGAAGSAAARRAKTSVPRGRHR